MPFWRTEFRQPNVDPQRYYRRMELNDYQTQSTTTAIYPGKGEIIGLLYVALGLGEAGELQGKVKKILRDDNMILTDEKREAIIGELGDVLWYAANLATELGTTLEDVAQRNLDKLFSRKERGTLTGSGDER